ncbi:hypothetical protein D0839_17125 [Bordetella avium]|nr:hypothetical protein C0J09_06565 [Bordetella avium]AZY52219.1 hypothetical protein C0J07_06635 [Bordetella avium]RIQ47395.1 hypothetical protein D0843_17300 [Bordetella avium]RIQ64679.1 hypothetical protein D0839_17125 [Bordetella avium]RIQ71025.1 hypothetical protein D0838_09875 [Bordetella avium]
MKGGPLARLAGQLCARRDFQVFCCARTPDEAAAFIRHVCGVQSRADLDHNTQARDRFHTLIRRPFAYRTGR